MQLLSQLKKHSTGIFTLAACALMAGGLATSPAFAAGGPPPDNKVTICHATGSETNPYVVITPAKAGVVNGHEGSWHQDARDIIPPFEWRDTSYPGQNWDAAGQAIFNAGCVKTVVTPPPTTQPPTTPATTPPGQPSGAASGQPGGAAKGNVPLGAAKAAPAKSVSIAAETAAGDSGADYTVSGALLGAGGLLLAWVLLTRYARRPRGQHAG